MSIITTAKEVTGFCKAKLNLEQGTFGTTMAFMLLALVVLAPHASYAGADVFANVVCNSIEELQGPIAKGVAAFGIIFLGFSLFLGKISWGVALALGIGVAAIFGAESIVGAMLGGTASNCTVTVVT